ncbi:hypothetical protein JQX08_10670 [Pseudomonas sp. UL073]|uniref:Uncharacterized protein n=1 Tax=Zestomonas insulae TaxID=2809017 RepID=A0ABS2IEI0_9GAMM|nr:hypothetical protein [Pseudomonas insulae]MBM7061170.1 hypothetical protein [Pseudomonas insulae]
MPIRHTRKLSALAFFAALLSHNPLPSAVAAEPGGREAQLSSSEQSRYLGELKRLYQTQNERKALLAHCNHLLDTYALKAGYQVGQSQRQDLLYQLSVSAPGELLVREESRAEQGVGVAVRNQRIELFGVDPFVRYECPTGGRTCVLLNPVDGAPLLTIVRDHGGAAELAKALSFLIRSVQKN